MEGSRKRGGSSGGSIEGDRRDFWREADCSNEGDSEAGRKLECFGQAWRGTQKEAGEKSKAKGY